MCGHQLELNIFTTHMQRDKCKIKSDLMCVCLTLDWHGLHLDHRGEFLFGHVITPPLPHPGNIKKYVNTNKVIKKCQALPKKKNHSKREGETDHTTVACGCDRHVCVLPHDIDEGRDGDEDDHGEQNQQNHQTQITFILNYRIWEEEKNTQGQQNKQDGRYRERKT